MERNIFVTTFKCSEPEDEGEVLFRIHTNGRFEYTPLRYEGGSIINVNAFRYDRGIFSSTLDNLLSEIKEPKWAVFFCHPNKSLENGLHLIYRDQDVLKLYEFAETHESVDIFVIHRPQMLAVFYLENIGFEVVGWLEEDANFRMSSGRPFMTRRKWKGIDKNKLQVGVVIKEGKDVIHDKTSKQEKDVIHDKSIKNKGKGKLIMEEDDLQEEKGEEVVKTYKRGFDGNGKAIMVEIPGFDGENIADGAGDCDVVPSGANKRFKSSEKITNCVLALCANKPS